MILHAFIEGPSKTLFRTKFVPRVYISCFIFKVFLVLNAASKQVKKIGLFAYRPIISLAMIIIGGFILFDSGHRGHMSNVYTRRKTYLHDPRFPGSTITYYEDHLQSSSVVLPISIIGLLYVCAGLFILFLLIFPIWFALNRFRKLKVPKLYSRTKKGSPESNNGSKYTPLISDV